MNRSTNRTWMTLAAFLLMGTPTLLASDADTSATATGGGHAGNAAATAHYRGDVGFARTDTRTGRINLARGVALGLDRDGLSFSLSTAIAPQRGPAFGSNFNVSINRRGDLSHSVGRVTARGGGERTVAVSGGASTGTHGHRGSAISQASGRTRYGGVVRATTRSRHVEIRRPVRVRYIRR